MTNGENMGYNPRQQKIADASRLVEEAQKNLDRARQQLDELVNPPVPEQPDAGSIITFVIRPSRLHAARRYVAIRQSAGWYMAGPDAPLGSLTWERVVDFVNDAHSRFGEVYLLDVDRDGHTLAGFRVD